MLWEMCAIQTLSVNASATLTPLHLHFGYVTFTSEAYGSTRCGMNIAIGVEQMLCQNSGYVTLILKWQVACFYTMENIQCNRIELNLSDQVRSCQYYRVRIEFKPVCILACRNWDHECISSYQTYGTPVLLFVQTSWVVRRNCTKTTDVKILLFFGISYCILLFHAVFLLWLWRSFIADIKLKIYITIQKPTFHT